MHYPKIEEFLSFQAINHKLMDHRPVLDQIISGEAEYKNDLGWFEVDTWGSDSHIGQIEAVAREVRQAADILVVIGVGGSNQAARAVIEAINHDNRKTKILYAGNNISATYLEKIIKQLDGKSVYINMIAKNFETLEPGISFRVLRQYLEGRYGESAKDRIITTGTQGSTLWQLAQNKGYTFLPFPENIGGRFSVISPVGLLPMAVAGVDIRALVSGAKEMETLLKTTKGEDNMALKYAAVRNLLLSKGYNIEILSFFEPDLDFFSKWWKQLFAESEGKKGKGIFPVSCSYSEDLHSIGQYIQEGQRILMETFIEVETIDSDMAIKPDPSSEDYFAYLDGKSLHEINHSAYVATLNAHIGGGVPCMVMRVPEITPYYFGQMFYFFEFACYLSGKILGINPFDQPGVEAYKQNMFPILGK